jgi:hypothetical protein
MFYLLNRDFRRAEVHTITCGLHHLLWNEERKEMCDVLPTLFQSCNSSRLAMVN